VVEEEAEGVEAEEEGGDEGAVVKNGELETRRRQDSDMS
jgi:hypothetical protein